MVTLVGILFAVVLVAVQLGMYFGARQIITGMIEHAGGDLWISAYGSESFEQAPLLTERERFTALSVPGVETVTPLIVTFSEWRRPDSTIVNVVVIGSDEGETTLRPWNVVEGTATSISPNGVIVDRTYAETLAVPGIGAVGELGGQRVKVEGLTNGIRSFTTSPYVFMSLSHAHSLLSVPSDQANFYLVKLAPGASAAAVKQEMSSRLPGASIFTRQEILQRNLNYWLFGTGAGLRTARRRGAWPHNRNGHRCTDALFEHEGPPWRVRHAQSAGLIIILHSQGYPDAGGRKRDCRLRSWCWPIARHRCVQQPIGAAGLDHAWTGGVLVRRNHGHVHDLGRLIHPQSHENRSSHGVCAMKQAPILEARHIVKELGHGDGKVQAVKGVNLTLFPGEFTLLMGPSGSGKTTLLSILGCILSPTSGTLSVSGECATGRTAEELANIRRRHFGFIFQAYNLFPTLNALDNVKIALDVRGFSAAECKRRAEAALHAVGLDHRLNSYPGTLSGGEKQRVAIARAIASSPSIVLADEPTSALDTENGHAIMALLAKLAKDENRTILAVTHDPRTIAYADRVIEIEDGRISGQKKSAQAPDNVVKYNKFGSGIAKNNQKRRRHVHA